MPDSAPACSSLPRQSLPAPRHQVQPCATATQRRTSYRSPSSTRDRTHRTQQQQGGDSNGGSKQGLADIIAQAQARCEAVFTDEDARAGGHVHVLVNKACTIFAHDEPSGLSLRIKVGFNDWQEIKKFRLHRVAGADDENESMRDAFGDIYFASVELPRGLSNMELVIEDKRSGRVRYCAAMLDLAQRSSTSPAARGCTQPDAFITCDTLHSPFCRGAYVPAHVLAGMCAHQRPSKCSKARRLHVGLCRLTTTSSRTSRSQWKALQAAAAVTKKPLTPASRRAVCL